MEDSAKEKINNIGSKDKLKSDDKQFSKTEAARINEEASKHEAKTTIRKHIVGNFRHLITALKCFIVFILLVYSVSMIIEPYFEEWVQIKKTFETIFYKIIELLPWILLFVFGDSSKVKEFLKLQKEDK